MSDSNMVLLEGFEFECTNFVSSEGTTAITVRVSGDGTSSRDLPGWILEMCPDSEEKKNEGINVISCEKRKDKSAWLPAIAQKTTNELMGDIGVSGVLLEEKVGKEKEDPAIEFRITFDKQMEPVPIKVAFISGPTVFKSMEKMQVKLPANPLIIRLWSIPIEKIFCLYFVVPEGYKPHGACKTNVSITKRGVFMHHETNINMDDTGLSQIEKTAVSVKTVLKGYIKIIASIPLKSYQACGDDIYATACDCFQVDEIVGYTNEKNKFEMRDISICSKKKSFDLTLLNAHCGKAVYRLDGKYIVDCKPCK